MDSRHTVRLLHTLIALLVGAGSAHAKGDVVSAPEPPPEAVLADIPFEKDAPSYRIFLNLAKEGSAPLVMLLDTGADYSVLTPLAARALGVTVRPHKSSPYRRSTRLGRDLQFWVDTNSSDTGSKTGWEVGLLGGNFLAEYVLELDFVNRRVRFLDPKKYQLPKSVSAENEAVVRITIPTTRPMITIERGDRKINALLDTGAPPALSLSGDATKQLGIDPATLSAGREVHGVLGPTDSLTGTASDLRIAGFGELALPVEVLPKGFYNQAGNTDSIVGIDWMKQFTLRIDYRRSRLWLRREVPIPNTQWTDWDKIAAEGPDPDPPPTDEEKVDLREAAARSDAEQLERWKQDTQTAVYIEENGGWVRVDGYRRRNGPKPGEVWMTYDEMMARRAQAADAAN